MIAARKLSRCETVGAFTRRRSSCRSLSVSSILDTGRAMQPFYRRPHIMSSYLSDTRLDLNVFIAAELSKAAGRRDSASQLLVGYVEQGHSPAGLIQLVIWAWLFFDDGPEAGVETPLVLADVKVPVLVEVAGQVDGAHLEHGLGHGRGPAHT